MTRKFVVLGLAALALVGSVACDKSKQELEKTLAQAQRVSHEKDMLLKDVMASSQFIAEVNTELAKVRSRTAGKPVQGQPGEMESNLSPAQLREAIKAKVIELTARLIESESRLTASRNRVRELTANNAGLASQLAVYDSTIAAVLTIIDNQKTEIASLQAEISGLKQEKAVLLTEKAQLAAMKDALTSEKNLAYYVVGTEGELLKKGIIVKQGGWFGFGKTAVPAANLKESDFTALDRTKVTEVAFRKADKVYKIVSRQDVTALAPAPDKSNRIKGGIKIADTMRFWALSRFLIVMEQ